MQCDRSLLKGPGADDDKNSKPLVSITAPVYNEDAVIEAFVDRTFKVIATLEDRYAFEVILVNDGSRDRSLEIMKRLAAHEPRLTVIDLRRNYGQSPALQAGFDAAEGSIVITMDADLQHFPEDIPRFLERLEQGYDVVCGWRHERKEGAIRRYPSRAANYLLRKVSGLTIRDIGTTFRAYRREIVADIRLLGENHRFIPIFAKSVGARIDEITIENIERPAGKSNYGLERTLNVFIDIFFLFFFVRYFDRPIRIFGKVALILGGLAGAIALWLVWLWAETGMPIVRERSGLFITSVIFMLASLQVLLAGVLGEMLSRLYFAGKGTNTYQVRTVWSCRTAGGAEERA